MSKTNVMTIRIPADLKRRIEIVAEEQGVSLNQLAMYMFAREISSFEEGNRISRYWKNCSKEEIMQGFDRVMAKVGKRRSPRWDRLDK